MTPICHAVDTSTALHVFDHTGGAVGLEWISSSFARQFSRESIQFAFPLGLPYSRFRDDILNDMDVIFSIGFLLLIGIGVFAFMCTDAGDSCCSGTVFFLLLITLGILAVFFGLLGIGCAAVILH